jgi:hypothetical protein
MVSQNSSAQDQEPDQSEPTGTDRGGAETDGLSDAVDSAEPSGVFDLVGDAFDWLKDL